MATTQANRLMSISTPLGEDFLLINRFSAIEEISSLFSFEVELLHEENQPGYEATIVSAESILGQAVGIQISQRDGYDPRFERNGQPFRAKTPRRQVYILLRDHRSAHLALDANSAKPDFPE